MRRVYEARKDLDRRDGTTPPPSRGESLSISSQRPERPDVPRADIDRMMKEQRAFALELDIVRDNRAMVAEILDHGERGRLAVGAGDHSVRRLVMALRRILGVSPLVEES